MHGVSRVGYGQNSVSYAMLCRYNAVIFPPNLYKRHPIVRPCDNLKSSLYCDWVTAVLYEICYIDRVITASAFIPHLQLHRMFTHSLCYIFYLLYWSQSGRSAYQKYLFWPYLLQLHIHLRLHSLQWRHDGRDNVSNYQPHDCLLNRLFRRRSNKTSKFRVTGLCAGNSPGTGEFPSQMASNAENVSIWWRHHVPIKYIREKNLDGHSKTRENGRQHYIPYFWYGWLIIHRIFPR